jgi:sensor histidine kinase regulating citrate/malate metabolism
MAFVIVTAVVTGIVVANWTGQHTANTTAAVKSPAAPAAPAASNPRIASTVPTQTAIDTCNKYAATPPSQRDKTFKVVKDAAFLRHALNGGRRVDEDEVKVGGGPND